MQEQSYYAYSLFAEAYGYTEPTALDRFLHTQGFFPLPLHSVLNEGFSTPSQRQAFVDDLKSNPHIRHILEIGFNTGHSAEALLEHSPLTSLVSFDINQHAYTPLGKDFLKSRYPERFEFIEGDSTETLPDYAQSYPHKKFDLFLIDGGHSVMTCLSDILNCKRLSGPNSVVWIDDYENGQVKLVVDLLEKSGFLQIESVKHTEDGCGRRSWAIARYL